MTQPLLFDTCALIWIATFPSPDHLGPVEDLLNQARAAESAVYLSPMTAWEIGMLAAKGRLPMPMPPAKWLARAMESGGMQWAGLPVEVLLASTTLPDDPHGDPADRIIIATAREYGLRLVTRDRKILDYAAKGHVMAVAC